MIAIYCISQKQNDPGDILKLLRIYTHVRVCVHGRVAETAVENL
jgi:hypothetical protein